MRLGSFLGAQLELLGVKLWIRIHCYDLTHDRVELLSIGAHWHFRGPSFTCFRRCWLARPSSHYGAEYGFR